MKTNIQIGVSMTFRLHHVLPLTMCFILLFGGCKPTERDRCTVERKATLEGKPLQGFHIVLYSEDTGGGGGEVTSDGSFKIHGPIQESEFKVYFVIPADTKGEARAKLEAVALPKKYRKAETSDYKVTLQPGKNVLEIDLKP